MVFTKILKPVLRWARRKGIRLTAYLDDLLIVAKDRPTSLLHTRLVLHKLTDLGFLVKHKKFAAVPYYSHTVVDPSSLMLFSFIQPSRLSLFVLH